MPAGTRIDGERITALTENRRENMSHPPKLVGCRCARPRPAKVVTARRGACAPDLAPEPDRKYFTTAKGGVTRRLQGRPQGPAVLGQPHRAGSLSAGGWPAGVDRLLAAERAAIRVGRDVAA